MLELPAAALRLAAHPVSTTARSAAWARDAAFGPPSGLEPEPGSVRFSAPVAEVVQRVVAGQEVSFWAEGPRGVRARPRVHLLLQPLREVVVLGEGPAAPMPGATREDWMVWQSVTGVARPTLLPTDAVRLAAELRIPRSREGRLAVTALRELMAAVYEARAI